MTRTQEIRPDIDDGIDRKVLTQLRGRFLKVNSGRLARTMQGLSTRQQLVLKLLPLLFHVNHFQLGLNVRFHKKYRNRQYQMVYCLTNYYQ